MPSIAPRSTAVITIPHDEYVLLTDGLTNIGFKGVKALREKLVPTPPVEFARDEVGGVIVRLARKSATLATVLNLMRYGEAKTRDLHHEQVDLLATPKVGPDPALAQTLLLLHRQRYLESYRERVREVVGDE